MGEKNGGCCLSWIVLMFMVMLRIIIVVVRIVFV